MFPLQLLELGGIMGRINGRVRVLAKTIAPGACSETSYTENIGLLPKNAYLIGTYGRVTTAFTGVLNAQVSLGVSGDTNMYMVAQPIDAVNELIPNSSGATGGNAILGLKGYCAGMNKERISPTYKPIIATFTSDDFSTLTAGEVEFAIVFVDCN
jgi:hypothetical protein